MAVIEFCGGDLGDETMCKYVGWNGDEWVVEVGRPGVQAPYATPMFRSYTLPCCGNCGTRLLPGGEVQRLVYEGEVRADTERWDDVEGMMRVNNSAVMFELPATFQPQDEFEASIYGDPELSEIGKGIRGAADALRAKWHSLREVTDERR